MFEDVAEYVSNNLEIQLGIIKIVYIFICSYFCNIKILDQKIKLNFKSIFKFILIVFNSILFAVVRYEISYVISILGWIFMTAIIFNKNEIRKSVFTTLVSLSINYIILLISTTINFIINIIFGINSNIINIVLIFIIHITLLILFFNVKKFKYGISSLKNIQQNEYIDILILTISSIILFSCILLSKLQVTKSISIGFIIFSISMIITIFKSLQLYYKQQMLIKDLNETREELEKKKKEIAEKYINVFIKSALLKANTDIYVIDNFDRFLCGYADYPQIQRYTLDVSESEVIFEEILMRLKHRKEMLVNGQDIKSEKPIVMIINSKDALEYISSTKPVLTLFNEITKTYKNMGVFVLYGDIEDEAVPYGAPELLKHLKDSRKAIVFDNLPMIKMYDVNSQFARKNTKQLLEDEGYWFNGPEIKKVKLITEE